MTASLAPNPTPNAQKPGSPAWLDIVRAELAVAWEESGRGKLEGCDIAEVIERPFSFVHMLDVVSPAGTTRLVAKSTVRDPMNQPFWDRQVQATVEFEILEHLHSRFDSLPGLSVPRPVCVMPELDTFVMERVGGAPLDAGHTALRHFASRESFKILGADYQRLGSWLARFQSFTKPGEGDASCLEGLEERIRLRLAKIAEANDPRVPSHFVANAERRLAALLQEAAAEPLPIAGRHGDFGPWNVLVSEGVFAPGQPIANPRAARELVVIDFMGYSREPRPLDAINVLHFLETESGNITTSPRRVRELQKRFLYGYASQEVYSRPLLVLCEFHARVYSTWGCLSTPVQRRHHRWQQNKALQRNMNWLQAENAPGVWQDLQIRSRIKT